MYPFERKDKILDLLRKEGQILINRDAHRLGVSRSTLHRDLEELQNLGLVKKVRGGATLIHDTHFETHFDIRLKTMAKEKQKIACIAARTVQDDTAVFLDHSSTTLYLAREIKNRQFHNLIVLTNSLVIPQELGSQRGTQVILTGGAVENDFKALSGRWVVEFLKPFNLHQIFASVGAVSVRHGLMTQIPFIYELLPEIFKLGGQINILVDSSKFHKIGTFQIAPLGPSLRLFSNRDLPEAIRKDIRNTGATLIV